MSIQRLLGNIPAESPQISQVHRKKVLAQASSILKPAEELPLSEVSRSIRRFLKIEARRLRIAHDSGVSGRQTAAMRSFIADVAIDHAFRRATLAVDLDDHAERVPDSCALIAVGGYGRGELAPSSDIDLLFLYSGSRLTRVKSISANLLSFLWDAGLTVGHSFRTVGDCTAAALSDTHLRTALVNMRLLAGSKALHNSLYNGLEKDRRRRFSALLGAVNREREARYAKFGAAVCLQEPNIKESAGGLRDYHTAIWLAHARYGYRTLDELRGHGLIAEDEARKAVRAYDFLWRVRHSAHFVTRRKTERLSLDLQPVLAKQFGYEAGAHSLGSENLMRDYYRQARELHLLSETMLARVMDDAPRMRRWRKGSIQSSEPYSIRNGNLQFDGEADHFDQKPLAIFTAFALAQAARVPFSTPLRGMLTRGMRRIGPAFRGSRETSAAFLNLIRRRGRAGYVLRMMHELGLLARLIPEFAKISLLVQHDLYHHFTVDEHTLKAIEALDDLHLSSDKQRAPLRTIFEELEDPSLLYLALLVHDIGKGEGRGHIARGAQKAERICARLQLAESDRKKIVLLVAQHVAMAHLAQRRDLNEPRLIANFAAKIGSLDALNMLLLLTYADLNAVGPGVWTEWKASLLWDLYRRTRKSITGIDEPPDDSTGQFKEQVCAVAASIPMSEVERHLALLPERYQRINSPDAVAKHLLLLEKMKSTGLALDWARARNSTTELSVCALDRHGLFADLAGTLAANGVEIMSAELNTREDGIALDTFILRQAATRQAVEEHRYQKLEHAIAGAVARQLDVAGLIELWRTRNAPRKRSSIVPARRQNLPRVVCDNEASPSFTLIEVHAVDEPGLAYKISNEIAALGFEIVCARIATERSDALDVFYVTDSEGLKLPDEMHQSIEQAISARLAGAENTAVDLNLINIAERETNEKSRGDYQATLA